MSHNNKINSHRPSRILFSPALILILLLSVVFLGGCQPDLTENCAVEISCTTILSNLKDLDTAKHELVPADGIIFAGEEVAFANGEDMLKILIRALKQEKIHLDFSGKSGDPMSYIMGVNNIYGGDVGGMSGWMVSVNGEFIMVAAGVYEVQQGDIIKLLYTVNGGPDIGYVWDGK